MKKEENKQEKEVDVLDILLDDNNDSPITLYDEKDKAIKFDQIAVIPLEDKLYAILKPIDEMDGVAEDEAIVFFIDEKAEEDSQLIVETDETIAMNVFDEYYKLLENCECENCEHTQESNNENDNLK